MDTVNLSAVREAFGKVVYTHKTREKAAEICVRRNKQLKRINVFLLILTSGSALGSVIEGEDFVVVTSILATLALFFIVYQLSFNPEQEGINHKRTAIKLWEIREKYQNLIADMINERYSLEENANRRDILLIIVEPDGYGHVDDYLFEKPLLVNAFKHGIEKGLRLTEKAVDFWVQGKEPMAVITFRSLFGAPSKN
jgi:hypothetical protein